jgi:hypothetical protein
VFVKNFHRKRQRRAQLLHNGRAQHRNRQNAGAPTPIAAAAAAAPARGPLSGRVPLQSASPRRYPPCCAPLLRGRRRGSAAPHCVGGVVLVGPSLPDASSHRTDNWACQARAGALPIPFDWHLLLFLVRPWSRVLSLVFSRKIVFGNLHGF